MLIHPKHQFIQRQTGLICNELLFGDRLIRVLYSSMRERAPIVFKALTSGLASEMLGMICFEKPLERLCTRNFMDGQIDFSECVEPREFYNTQKKVFQRQIRYWEKRPMSERDDEVVSPADSRVIVGTQNEISALFVKEKFFSFEELLGHDKTQWNLAFMSGEFVICRLTPEKYHYNHTPVSGEVVDFYEVSGSYHSCNPTALVEMVTPISKNRRVVTIIDTDVEHGTKIGLVAMIEVVALMVGDIVQEYCEDRYQNPKPINKGLFLKKGVPKSLFRPGSSTLVLLFQRGQIYFMDDLIRNRFRPGVESRFSLGFGQALAETDLDVRSPIARKRPND